MKGKRYTTEEKIRILREADSDQSILEVCREHNLSEATFHRWKRQSGQMEVNEAKRDFCAMNFGTAANTSGIDYAPGYMRAAAMLLAGG